MADWEPTDNFRTGRNQWGLLVWQRQYVQTETGTDGVVVYHYEWRDVPKQEYK